METKAPKVREGRVYEQANAVTEERGAWARASRYSHEHQGKYQEAKLMNGQILAWKRGQKFLRHRVEV
jgi:hypothetical protein